MFVVAVVGLKAQVNSHKGYSDVYILVAVVFKNFWRFLCVEWSFGLG